MNTQNTEIDVQDLESKKVEIVPFEENIIAQAFKTEGGLVGLYTSIEQKLGGLVFDVNSGRDRAEMKSLAYAISRTKTTVDDYGKDLVAGIKKQAKVIDEARKDWREKCDALRDQVRGPLNDWEAAEEAKKQVFQNRVAAIELVKNYDYSGKTSQAIQTEISQVKAIVIDEENFSDFINDAKLAKYEALEFLDVELTKALEREDFTAKQAAEEAAAREAREEQIRAQAKAQAEAEAQVKIEAAQRQAEAAQRQAQEAEARAKAQAEAEAQRKDQDEARRAADLEHKKTVHREIVEAMCAFGWTEDDSKSLMKEIYNGKIPHLKIVY